MSLFRPPPEVVEPPGEAAPPGVAGYDKRGQLKVTCIRGLEVLTDRIGGTSTCWMPFLACICALMRAAAAAAAAAAFAGSFFSVEAVGLRLLWPSFASRLEGERER